MRHGHMYDGFFLVIRLFDRDRYAYVHLRLQVRSMFITLSQAVGVIGA